MGQAWRRLVRRIVEAPDFLTAGGAILDEALEVTRARRACLTVHREGELEQRLLERGLACPAGPIPEGVLRLREEASRADTPVWDNALGEPARNVLLAPLHLGGRGRGYLVLGDKPGGFDARDAEHAESLAGLAALGLREATEAERARSREGRLRATLDEVSDGILLADPASRRFVMANRAICDLLGYSEEELLHLGIEDIHPAADLPRVLEAFDRQLRRLRPLAPELPVRRKSGEVFHADITAMPITIDGRQLIMGSFRDATERRALQMNMAQADRLASMGTLAAGVAHEINNPLSYLLYNLQIVGEDLPAMIAALRRCTVALEGEPLGRELAGAAELLGQRRLDELLSRLAAIQDGARRIKEFAKALSTFSRVEQSEPGLVKLDEAAEHAVAMTFHEIKYRARLSKELGPVPLVRAAAGKLSQVFLHLLLNAAYAIPEGAAEQHAIRVRTWGEGGTACAEVSDTGCGIAPDHLGRVFEPFFTTRDVGHAGLGLSICKNLVEAIGGTISLSSELGRGTTVRLTLPGCDVPGARLVPTPRPAPRGRILVVDDDPGIRNSFERMLGAEHEVVCAGSGAEARALLEAGARFDVIFCDLMMPSVTGMDLHAWIAEHDPVLAARMVFISGGAFTPRAREFLGRVPNVRLEKPLEAEVVLGVASVLIAASQERSR
jgi:PAS domain S-box-containing protein